MSILDLWVSDGRALVAVDTQGVCKDLTRLCVAKIFPMPHAEMVVAVRGIQVFGRAVYEVLNSRDLRFDEAVLCLPAVLQQADAMVRAAAVVDGIDPDCHELQGNDLLLIGWSDAAAAFRATFQERRDKAIGFTERAVAPWLVGPCEPAWGDMPTQQMDSIDDLFSLAEWQYRNGRRSFPDGGLGGSIIVAELTRGQMLIKSRPLAVS